MKKLAATFLLTIVTSSLSCAQDQRRGWKKDGIPTTNTADRKAENGFGAAVIVVEDPKGFVERWYKPDFPDFETVKEVQPSVEIGAFIMFAGCKPGSDGKCDTTVDYALISPDGKVIGDSLNQIVWNGNPPPTANTHISKASMILKFRESNKLGEYKLRAVVYDKNAKISLSLETQFELK